MNQRIEEIRKHVNLSREKFGGRIGLSSDVINNLERGRVEIKPYIIKLICSEYGINKAWLETGEGEMFCAEKRQTKEEILSELLGMLPQLSTEQLDALRRVVLLLGTK